MSNLSYCLVVTTEYVKLRQITLRKTLIGTIKSTQKAKMQVFMLLNQP